MSQKYRICLEISDLDTFIVVMKVVEKNAGIRVTEAGMPILQNAKMHVRQTSKAVAHHRNSEGTAKDLFVKYLKQNKMSEFHYRTAKEWFVKNKYAENTASSTVHALTVDKRLKKHPSVRSMYQVV